MNRKKPMLMVVDGLEGEALQAVNMNNARGVLSVVAVQGPTHGENRQRELEDMEAMVGGQAIAGAMGSVIEKVTEDALGHAERVVVEKDKTTIVGGNSNTEKIESRIARIREEMQEYKAEFTTQVCQARLSRLAGGTAVLKVGASTETEYKEKKLRIEDALNAARAAMAEGVVVGGGTTYLRILPALDALTVEEADVQTGVNLVKRALKQPLAQIAANAGKEPFVIVEQVAQLPAEQGYNVITDQYEDLLAAGIIEPAKVVKAALQHAVSVAMMALTVESLVAEVEKKEEQ